MLVLVFVACFLFYCAFSPKAEAYYKACMFLVFAVSAFRHPILGGADTFQYYDYFMKIKSLSDVLDLSGDGFQIGYVTLTAIPRLIFGSYIWFQICYIALCSFLLHKTIKALELSGQEKILFLFGFFCYDYLWYFWGTLRQNVADLLFFYLLINYYKNSDKIGTLAKLAHIVVMIYIPYLFHSSAAMTLFVMPFVLYAGKNVNPRTRFIWVAIGSVVVFITSSTVFSGLASYLASFDDRYQGYVDDEGVGANIINIVFRNGVFYLFCSIYNDIDYKYKRLVLNAATFFVLIGAMSQGVAGRMSEYFAFGFYVAMSFIGQYKKKYGTIVPIYFMALMVVFIRKMYTSDGGLNSHYYLFFQDPTDVPAMFYYFWKDLTIY